ncbi:MAG TPA: ABC transporter substrate-binding protein [Acidimicrobiales bacterium]|nr:ABC transporter substrate-binding protein [Acidimicrobiales bacterium]
MKRLTAVAVVAVMALFSAACGSNDNGGAVTPKGTTTTRPSTAGAGSLKSKLPTAIASAGVIKVGSDVAYAPIEFFKEGTQEVIGLDPDLADALGTKLGVKFQFTNSTFDGLITAVNAGRFDLIMSSMSDNKKRQDSGVDFVDYFNAGTSIIVQKGNPQKINSLDDLCGKTIGLQKGTTQEDAAKAQDKKCQSANKGGVNILTFEKDTDALQSLKAGRSVADMNDFPVAAYNAKTSGGGNDFEVVGEQIDAGPYGIAVPKTNEQLRNAVQEALQAIIADGTYDSVLAKWGLEKGALKTAAINGGT